MIREGVNVFVMNNEVISEFPLRWSAVIKCAPSHSLPLFLPFPHSFSHFSLFLTPFLTPSFGPFSLVHAGVCAEGCVAYRYLHAPYC